MNGLSKFFGMACFIFLLTLQFWVGFIPVILLGYSFGWAFFAGIISSVLLCKVRILGDMMQEESGGQILLLIIIAMVIGIAIYRCRDIRVKVYRAEPSIERSGK